MLPEAQPGAELVPIAGQGSLPAQLTLHPGLRRLIATQMHTDVHVHVHAHAQFQAKASAYKLVGTPKSKDLQIEMQAGLTMRI